MLRNLAAALAWVIVAVLVALVPTAISLHHFASDCAADGGTYSREGGTVWCRY